MVNLAHACKLIFCSEKFLEFSKGYFLVLQRYGILGSCYNGGLYALVNEATDLTLIFKHLIGTAPHILQERWAYRNGET